MPKIYTVIVTYNGEAFIDKCLRSLQGGTLPQYTIVVDNQSTDSTVELIKANHPEVELIESETNLGFGKANNIGFKRALEDNADYIFLLNQDAWVEADTIEKLVSIHQENPQYGILSPFHKDYTGENIEYYFSLIINPLDCPNLISDLHMNKQKAIYDIKFIHAACWLLSKECLQTVGGFDPIFPHYTEDNDYVKRAKYFNFGVGLIPYTLVYHQGTNNSLKNRHQDFQLQFNFVVLHLKNISCKFKGLFLTQQKELFDRFTSAILKKKPDEMKMSFRLWKRSISRIPDILKSRKACKQKGAFLR